MATNPRWPVAPSEALCVTECGARCCQGVGSLVLSQREAERMALRHPTPLVLYREFPNGYRLNFSDHDGRCPMLAPDNRCRSYTDRPVACHRFPAAPDPRCLVWPLEAP